VRRILCIALTSAFCIGVPAGGVFSARSNSGDWPTYASDLRGTKYSSLELVDAANFRDLRIVWRWNSPDSEIVKQNPSLHLNLFEATPLEIDGVLYVATYLHQIAAIDAKTGITLWVYDPGVYRRGVPERTGFVHRGVAAWGSSGARRILAGTGDGYLIALDAQSGALITAFGTGGRVDLTKGLRRPVERMSYGIDSPPLVIGDIVVVGSFVSDGWSTKEGPLVTCVDSMLALAGCGGRSTRCRNQGKPATTLGLRNRGGTRATRTYGRG